MKGVLVIGYGNELRGDDAAGPRVAAAVHQWQLPGVRARICHQLTPELAEAIAGAGAVIFVDAACRAEPGVRIERVGQAVPASRQGVERPSVRASERENALMTHTTSPKGLMALAFELYGQCPPGWMVSIPGHHFELGERLSPEAQAGVAAALARIRELCSSTTNPDPID